MIFRDLFRGNDLWSVFFAGSRSRERSETIDLYHRVRDLYLTSPYSADDTADAFYFSLVTEACERAEVVPTIPLGEAFFAGARRLILDDGLLFGFPGLPDPDRLTVEEGVALRIFLRRRERFLADQQRLIDILREKVIRIFQGIVGYLPPIVFSDGEEADDERTPLSVALVDLCDNQAEVIERVCVTMCDDDVVNAGLFDPIRDRLDRNLRRASGIPVDQPYDGRRKLILPTEINGKSPAALVETYLSGTGFETLFTSPLPFHIPLPARFEHTHIVGGTGHGKTQLMQTMISEDLTQAMEDFRSVVVIDSQGDMLRTISRLPCFSPQREGGLSDRLLIVDPNDVEYPVALNMFDWRRDEVSALKPVDRERILNGTIDLYEYFFGALLGAELTARQGIIFKYIARLMLEIPEATIHTFRQLMEDGEPFRPYMERLPPTAQSFFQTRFFDRSFNETKKQVLTRLWGVLSNPIFDRMFSHPKSKVDLFAAMQEGRIILINTAKELLQHEGSAILGRFFIALIAQAVVRRSTLSPHERTPAFVYIDEAQDYFDQSIEHLLNQARKYKVGMILAHQNLDQLSAGLRASILASTTIKFAGGASSKDASTFASEMRSEHDFIHGMRKRTKHTEFACFVRNITPQAIQVSVPLGFVERFPQIEEDEYREIVEENRRRYCIPLSEVPAQPISRSPQPVHPKEPRPPEPKQERPKVVPEPPVREVASPPPVQPQPQVASPEAHPEPQVERLLAEEARPPDALRPPRQGRRVAKPSEPPTPGRGGREHKYLQHFIKQLGEERGFRASVEEEILDGAGRVDVALTRGEMRIACEISITTKRDQELSNIEKCLAAGFSQVILVATDERHLKAMERFIGQNLEETERPKVSFLTPDALPDFLGADAPAPVTTEQIVKGYKVKVTRQPLDPALADERRRTIAQVLARSLKSTRTEQ